MNNYLRVTFAPDNDGTGELRVEAAGDGFAGRASAWFSLQDLRDFVTGLRAYPLPDTPVQIAGGYWKRTGELKECHVSIAAYVAEGRGLIGVHVRLATPSPEPSKPYGICSAELELKTGYNTLAKFADQLSEVIAGRASEALLVGGEP
ncbi:MAG: hypothetical protein JO128_02280 [Alphaproteobacteria bacterium]|nr:hypothetical protein [Alphaproteobacteria bacterium]